MEVAQQAQEERRSNLEAGGGAAPAFSAVDILNRERAQDKKKKKDQKKPARLQDDGLLAANDGPFKHHLDRYKYSTRYDDVDPEEHGVKAVEHLGVLDERLARSAYLCGAKRGFADIAIFPFVRQFVNADKEWFAAQGLTHVDAWLTGLTGSELFTSIMTKHDRWKAA